ncbi:MAG TPA: hypothetical protein PKH07_04240, partial [bacterium]|nr:hypothetical protein [bacterium]
MEEVDIFEIICGVIWIVGIAIGCLLCRAQTASANPEENLRALQEIRQRYSDFLTLSRAPIEDKRLRRKVAQFDDDVQSLLDRQILDESDPLYGTFGDVTDERSH